MGCRLCGLIAESRCQCFLFLSQVVLCVLVAAVLMCISGENYEAEHYGCDHWHLRTDVDRLLERQRLATQRTRRKCLEADLPNEFFHVNRFRRWWVNVHVMANLLAFALRLSVCECVTQNPGRAIENQRDRSTPPGDNCSCLRR